MSINPSKERVMKLKEMIGQSDDLQPLITDLNDILSGECAQLDKAKVA